MKLISVVLIVLNITLSLSAFSSSSVSTGNGFQTTTCTGPCCAGNGACVITVPQLCTSTAGAWQGNYFGFCNVTTCPPATVVTPVAGCSVVNVTTGMTTTWWGYINIANVPITIIQGVHHEFENSMSVAMSPPTTSFNPYLLY